MTAQPDLPPVRPTRRLPELLRTPLTVAAVGLGVGVFFAGLTVVEQVPGEHLARNLRAHGVQASSRDVREHLASSDFTSRRDHVLVTFTTADGRRVTDRLRGVAPLPDVHTMATGWRPGSGEYQAPLRVTYNPEHPLEAMATDDVAGLADGGDVHSGWVFSCAAAVTGVVTGAFLLALGMVGRRRPPTPVPAPRSTPGTSRPRREGGTGATRAR